MIHLLKKISVSVSRAFDVFRANKFFTAFTNNGGTRKDSAVQEQARHYSKSIWYVNSDLSEIKQILPKSKPPARNKFTQNNFKFTNQVRNKFIVNDADPSTSPYVKVMINKKNKNKSQNQDIITAEESQERLAEFWQNLRRQKHEWEKYNLLNTNETKEYSETSECEESPSKPPVKFEFKSSFENQLAKLQKEIANKQEAASKIDVVKKPIKFEFKLPVQPKMVKSDTPQAAVESGKNEPQESEVKKPVKFKFKPLFRFDDITPSHEEIKEEVRQEEKIEEPKDEKLVDLRQLQIKKLQKAMKSNEEKKMVSFKSTAGLSYNEIVERARKKDKFPDEELKDCVVEKQKQEPEVFTLPLVKEQKIRKKRLLCVEDTSESEGPRYDDIWEEPLDTVISRHTKK